MRVVVTDACIFIDVLNLQITSKFFDLDLDIHTTADVINELFDFQKQILEGYKAASKLTVHVLSGEEQMSLLSEDYPKALTQEDRSVIFIAKKIGNAVVLSSDKPVRNYAKKLSIEYHGMLWILDQLVNQEILTKAEGISKITTLFNSNLLYKNNEDMRTEVEKRVQAWS